MFYTKAFWSLIAVIGIGIAVFLIDDQEVASQFWRLFILLVLAVLKSAFFLWLNLFILPATSGRQFDFFKYLVFFGISTTMIVLSFSIDFFCLYCIDGTAFANIPLETDRFGEGIAFFYYSLATFSTAGFGDIYPATTAGRLLAILELMSLLSTMVFILSNIHPLRESIIIRNQQFVYEDTDS